MSGIIPRPMRDIILNPIKIYPLKSRKLGHLGPR